MAEFDHLKSRLKVMSKEKKFGRYFSLLRYYESLMNKKYLTELDEKSLHHTGKVLDIMWKDLFLDSKNEVS